jgi:hypothetical protein
MALEANITRKAFDPNGVEAAIEAANTLGSYAVAGVPSAATYTGRIIYVSNGAAGSPCLAYSNGTNWLRITLGAAVAAS